MPVIAVTGHLNLTEQTVPLIQDALHTLLAAYPAADLTGISCLAEGADALFAAAVLAAGGRLVAVLPAADYRSTKVTPHYTAEFDRLHQAADEVVVLPFAKAGQDAYAAANTELLRRADQLIAIWDGHPGTAPGGTAHTVTVARAAGLPVTVIWPPGAARSSARRASAPRYEQKEIS